MCSLLSVRYGTIEMTTVIILIIIITIIMIITTISKAQILKKLSALYKEHDGSGGAG